MMNWLNKITKTVSVKVFLDGNYIHTVIMPIKKMECRVTDIGNYIRCQSRKTRNTFYNGCDRVFYKNELINNNKLNIYFLTEEIPF